MRESVRYRIALLAFDAIPPLRQYRVPRVIIAPSTNRHRPFLAFMENVDQLPIRSRRQSVSWVKSSICSRHIGLHMYYDVIIHMCRHMSMHMVELESQAHSQRGAGVRRVQKSRIMTKALAFDKSEA